VKVTAYLHPLAMLLRMSGAVRPLSQHAFIPCTGNTLHLGLSSVVDRLVDYDLEIMWKEAELT